MATERPPTIDPVAAARWQCTTPPASPWLHEEVARRMQERLGWIKQQPRRWAHWEPVHGGLETHQLIAQRYPQAMCYVVEPTVANAATAAHALAPSKPWWKPAQWGAVSVHVNAALPSDGVQLVWSNMALHAAADPQALLAQWHAALATDGFLMFSCLGPDTLATLHGVYRALGWGEAGSAFTDMHDWGDMLVAAGFAEPVMDMERISLSWSTPTQLLTELRGIGRNLHAARFSGLRTPRWYDRLEQALAERLRSAADGRLTLDFEIVYGHAFKPPPRRPRGADQTIGLSEMRNMLKGGRDTSASSRGDAFADHSSKPWS